jgi:hypothetical protein
MAAITPSTVAHRCRPRSCDTKTCYETRALAIRELRRIQLHRERHNSYFPRSVYFCVRHDSFHLSSLAAGTFAHII